MKTKRTFLEAIFVLTISDPQNEVRKLADELKMEGKVPNLSLLLQKHFQLGPDSLREQLYQVDRNALHSFVQTCINSMTIEDFRQWMVANRKALEEDRLNSQLPN